MLPGCCKKGIVISNVPVIQSGLNGMMQQHFPDYELTSYRTVEALSLLQLCHSDLVIADLTGECRYPRNVCEQFYTLISQCHDIHWVFLVSRAYYAQAVELLMGPSSTLLSDVESIESLVKAIRAGSNNTARISKALLLPMYSEPQELNSRSIILTLSERKVLRLLGKGWGINQIAMLLKKSNKTISAQKNSAMRRLSIHSNAEMYAWINSSQGARELNLPTAYGDSQEWKTEAIREISHS